MGIKFECPSVAITTVIVTAQPGFDYDNFALTNIAANEVWTPVASAMNVTGQLKYRLPRLSERSTALSRLTGGIGGRGPGETRLEIDMRRARDKIRRLEKQLDDNTGPKIGPFRSQPLDDNQRN